MQPTTIAEKLRTHVHEKKWKKKTISRQESKVEKGKKWCRDAPNTRAPRPLNAAQFATYYLHCLVKMHTLHQLTALTGKQRDNTAFNYSDSWI